MEVVSVDWNAAVVLPRAGTFKIERTIKIICEVYLHFLPQGRPSKPHFRNNYTNITMNSHSMYMHFPSAKRKTRNVWSRAMNLYIGNRKLWAWLDVVIEHAVNVLFRTSSMNVYVRGMSSSIEEAILRQPQHVHIGALVHKIENISGAAVTNERFAVMEALNREKIPFVRQTVIQPRLQSSLHVVPAAALRIFESKALTNGAKNLTVAPGNRKVLLFRFQTSMHTYSIKLAHLSKRTVTAYGKKHQL